MNSILSLFALLDEYVEFVRADFSEPHSLAFSEQLVWDDDILKGMERYRAKEGFRDRINLAIDEVQNVATDVWDKRSLNERLQRVVDAFQSVYDWRSEFESAFKQKIGWTPDKAGEFLEQLIVSMNYQRQHLQPISDRLDEKSAPDVTKELNEFAQEATPLTFKESCIIQVVGDDTLFGEQIADKAGYPYNSRFRQSLSELVKRGELRHPGNGRGYYRPK